MNWRQLSLGLFALLFVLVETGTTHSALIVSLDLNPFTTEIDSTLTVSQGVPFAVSAFIMPGDSAVFDGFRVDLNFNDTNGVLSLLQAQLGGLRGFRQTAIDLGSGNTLTLPNPPLTPLSSSPESAFSSSIAVGASLVGAVVQTPGSAVPPDDPVELARFIFVGRTGGTSNISFDALRTEITLRDVNAGTRVPIAIGSLSGVSVTVAGTGGGGGGGGGTGTIPEPTSIVSWILGSTLLVWRTYRSKVR